MSDEEVEPDIEPKIVRRPMTRDEILRMRQEQENRLVEIEEAGENGLINLLLTKFHINPKVRSRMMAEAKRRTDQYRLTLDMFMEFVPNFPIYLGYRKVQHKAQKEGGTSTGTLPELFKKFKQAPFVKPYEEFREEALRRAGGKCIGMVFPRLTISHGLIVHDGVGMERFWTEGFVCVYNGGTLQAPTRRMLQPFGALVEGIMAAGYEPDFSI